ncbi:MAG: imidazole glycerol phosphate synthase subunit HisF [Actinomycetota bacterium]|nr:imidazole glycerol phosphate synthase subunit HisF [Actinomycetota bacterium]
MRSVRVIPCLDIDAGRVVKGTNFVDLTDAGDPVELAALYDLAGADEIVFLDIAASSSSRPITLDLLSRAADQVFIPLTIGGGVSRVDDARQLLRAGADKVSLNSSAISNPALISEIAQEFGSQCAVVAIDAKFNGSFYEVYTHGGRNATGLELGTWAKVAERLGAGELLVTSMDRDGTKEGFDIGALMRVAELTSIPIIASGGVGRLEHFLEGAEVPGVSGLLAASVFHFGQLSISQVKNFLISKSIVVRPVQE